MKIYAIAFIILMLTSCDAAIKDRVVGNYYLVATDVPEDLALTYGASPNSRIYSDVVASTVFAVGYNDKYIIAKQHPPHNKKIINYYIVPIYKIESLTMKGLIGPLSENEFKNKCIQMNLEDIKFTIVYNDL